MRNRLDAVPKTDENKIIGTFELLKPTIMLYVCSAYTLFKTSFENTYFKYVYKFYFGSSKLNTINK